MKACLSVCLALGCAVFAGVAWGQNEQVLRPAGLEAGFGQAVAIDGNYAVVGARNWNSQQGAAFVYKCGADGQWVQTAKLTASDYNGTYAIFGHSVGISGEWIIVGSPWYHVGAAYTGRVYFFKRNANETWTQMHSFASPFTAFTDPYAGTFSPGTFGMSVAIDQYYAVAGDPAGRINDRSRGHVAVYKLTAGVWSVHNRHWYDPVDAVDGTVSELGACVDIVQAFASPWVVAGAPGSWLLNDPANGIGRAFVLTDFSRRELLCADPETRGWYGKSVAIDVDAAIDGQFTAAVGDLDQMGAGGVQQAGAVYVFDLDKDTHAWSQVSKKQLEMPYTLARFGTSVDLWNNMLAVGSLFQISMSGPHTYNAPVRLYQRDNNGPNAWGLFREVRPRDHEVEEKGFGEGDTCPDGIALGGNRLIASASFGNGNNGEAFVFNSWIRDALAPAQGRPLLSEICTGARTGQAGVDYIELVNRTNRVIHLDGARLVISGALGGVKGGGLVTLAEGGGAEDALTYTFPSYTTVPTNGCLVLSRGATCNEFEAAWSVDLDTAVYQYQIGPSNLAVGADCTYRLEYVAGSVTNALDESVVCPDACARVRVSNEPADWWFRPLGEATPGTLAAGQFEHTVTALPFFEDWSSSSFTSNAWTFAPSQGNWRLPYPSQIAEFYYSPSRSSAFQYALQTPVFSGKNKANVRVAFDVALDMFSGLNKGYRLDVDVCKVGGGWSTVASFTDAAGDRQWNGQSVDVTVAAAGDLFQVRFNVSGANTSYLNYWRVDNIAVTADDAPMVAPEITAFSAGSGRLQFQWTESGLGCHHRILYDTRLDGTFRNGLTDYLAEGGGGEMSCECDPPENVTNAFFRVRAYR